MANVKRGQYYGNLILNACGLLGVPRAIASFPKWEVLATLALLALYGWYFANGLWTSYGFGLLFGFVGGVQVGGRVKDLQHGDS